MRSHEVRGIRNIALSHSLARSLAQETKHETIARKARMSRERQSELGNTKMQRRGIEGGGRKWERKRRERKMEREKR